MKKYIEEFLDYLKDKRSDNTIIAYTNDLMGLFNYLEEHKDATVVEYADMIKTAKAGCTAIRKLTTLKLFYKYLVEKGYLEKNPMDEVEIPKQRNPEPKKLSEKEARRLLDIPKGYSPKAVRDRAMIAVMMETGLRYGQIVALLLSDADELRISKKTREMLEDYIYGSRGELLKDNKCDMLFINHLGEGLSRQGIWRIIKEYKEMENQES